MLEGVTALHKFFFSTFKWHFAFSLAWNEEGNIKAYLSIIDLINRTAVVYSSLEWEDKFFVNLTRSFCV